MIQILPMYGSARNQVSASQTSNPTARTDILCRVLFALAMFFALVSATGFICGVSIMISDARASVAEIAR